MKHNFEFMTGVNPPEDGVTGANTAGPSSLYAYCDAGNGGLYINVGTKADPQWKKLAVIEE